MSIILLCGLIGYLIIAITFNLMFISFYTEEKESFTGNRFADMFSLFLGAALWPLVTICGLCKMSKQDDKEVK